MIRFILKRILETIPVLLVVATITFFLIRLTPGGPFDTEKVVTEEIKRNIEAHYGMDKSLPVQYLNYLGNLLQGDLGPSFKYPSRSVNEIIAESFPVSLELGFYSMLIALVIGIGVGVVASTRPNTARDYVPSSLAMLGICLPTFVLGPLLILVFALWLGWYNASGWFFAQDKILPALTLGGYYAAYVARLTRGGMLEVLSQDYIRTARAKGVKESRVLFRHALRNAAVPILTVIGTGFALLISGVVVTESVFNIPGIGRLTVDAILARDYPVIQAMILITSATYVVVNLIIDISYTVFDPRIRY